MKALLLVPILGIALFASSCRTSSLLDPMTMKPTTRCLPENIDAPATGDIEGTK